MADDEIVYGEPLGPRVTQARPLDGHRILLTFSNGERRLFDAKPLLALPAFEKLGSRSFFNSVKVEFGTIAWPQNIDYCPDTLYRQSIPIDPVR